MEKWPLEKIREIILSTTAIYECHDTEPGRKPSCFLLEELEREELQLHLFQDEQHDDLDDPFFEFDTPEKAVAGKDAVDLYEIVEDQMCDDDE